MGDSVCQKVNTGKLNMNGQQEREHKAHPKQSYRKCLTTLMCLGCNKDLWSQRSKYKSYGALRV